jgi:peptidoglycan/xylan/chitin deacetylase (PgdA/CDA1 family)
VNNLLNLSGRLLSLLVVVSLAGCKTPGNKGDRNGLFGLRGKKNQGSDDLVFNGGSMGDPAIVKRVSSSIDRASQKVASRPGQPGRNPDMNLPPVDMSKAKSVTYHSVNVDGPYLAMTFDDGPHPSNTPRLLDMLAERNIKATFYVVGTNAKLYPHLIQRMVAEGHEIGNHTVTHPTNMSRLPKSSVERELRGCESSIMGSGGRKPRTMRPPGGSVNSAQKIWMNDEFGYKTILWSCDPEDWKRPGVSVVASRLIAGAKPGAILLAHDLHAPTVAAMPQTLDGILAKGFRFVTVSQLISMEQRPTADANIQEKLDSPESTITTPEPLPVEETILPAVMVEPSEELTTPVNPG